MPLDKAYRDTLDVASAIVRLVRAVGRRAAGEDPDSLQALLRIEGELAAAWRTAVDGLRESGASDSAIGAELGITRQAVQQRWPRSYSATRTNHTDAAAELER